MKKTNGLTITFHNPNSPEETAAWISKLVAGLAAQKLHNVLLADEQRGEKNPA